MINNLLIFIAALFAVMKGATMATNYASSLARSFRISRYAIGFIVISIISILPETLISLNAAIKGIPSFGLGMLFGSNIADLTLVFAAVVLFSGRSLKIEAKIIKNHVVYPLILILPLILGLNGHFSRLEGLALILVGFIFYYLILKNSADGTPAPVARWKLAKDVLLLLGSLAIMLIGGYFVVSAAAALAGYLGVSPILIGMLVVGLGTTIPELFFSLKSVKAKDDSLAVGDLLGTVLADATIVLGLLAAFSPFYFPVRIIYVTGVFMVVSSFMLFRFMRSGHTLTRRETGMLLAFWVFFVLIELLFNT